MSINRIKDLDKEMDVICIYDGFNEGYRSLMVKIYSKDEALREVLTGSDSLFLTINPISDFRMQLNNEKVEEIKEDLNNECNIKTYDIRTGKEIQCKECKRHELNGRSYCLKCGKRFKKII